MAKDKKPVEAILILENLDPDILQVFSSFENSKYYSALKTFCRRYAETKRNQILDLDTEDERKFANEAAIRKGGIFSLGVLIDVIEGAKNELDKRNPKG